MDAEARRGAIAFLCAIEDGCAGRIESAPGGCAILDPRHPRLWDANHLRVQGPEAPDAVELDAAAGLHFGELEFQMISVLHEEVGRALTEPLHSLGYRARHNLLMSSPRTRGAPRPRTRPLPRSAAIGWRRRGSWQRSTTPG